MNIFLDTANIQEIRNWSRIGIIDGITTNPSSLSKEGGNPTQIIRLICEALPSGDISVEITETEPERVYRQAHQIAELGENVIVKIPCHLSYYSVIDQLIKEDISINITLVFTLIQALAMCKLKVQFISPFIARWDDIGVGGIHILNEISTMVDEYGYDTQVLAASIRDVNHLRGAIMSGADVVTVAPSVLSKAFHHPLTDNGIKKFAQDWAQLGDIRFP